MSSEFLASYMANGKDRANRTAPQLLASPEHKLAIQNSFHYRQCGASTFLHTGNARAFFDCLHRSAGSFLHYLKRGDENEKRTSECDPLFDALTAGLLDAAQEIAKYSRQTPNTDYEYEEDFYYAHFLLSYFFRRDSVDDQELEKILKDWETILNGDSDVKLDICKSFFEKDRDLFVQAFEQFLFEREEKLQKKIESDVIGEEEWAWSKYLSVEALALLRLASMMNFKTESNYQQVPEMLRSAPAIAFQPDHWQTTLS